MKDRQSIIGGTGVIEDNDWPQLVSGGVGTDGHRPTEESSAFRGAIVGKIVGFVDDVLLVSYPGQLRSDAVPCRTIVDVPADAIGREALLICEQGDARRPILIGLLRGEAPSRSLPETTVAVDADQRRVTVTAEEQLVLQCGTASITLTKAGKLILRGEYISQRSAGVVRIKGGCVEIN